MNITVRWLSVVILSAFALFCYASPIKDAAPKTYVVKPGDTLWDIARMYLETPWRWPQLWRNNSDLLNPHLIYPGDIIRIVIDDGEAVLVIERNPKLAMTLSPTGHKSPKENQPIDLLPISDISPYIEHDQIISQSEFDSLPKLLGDSDGSLLFSDEDVVLAEDTDTRKTAYSVVRKHNTLEDEDGDVIGIQIRQVAIATQTAQQPENSILVSVSDNKAEVRPGDRLMAVPLPADDLILSAATSQTGSIIDSIDMRRLMGKFDVAVVDIGDAQLTPGMVMGIYAQGPSVYVGQPPTYASDATKISQWISGDEQINQPALKVGELIIVKTFATTSYGLITKASKTIRKGAIVAHP